ncbi:TPA: hypothetical protein ACUNL2_001576 [Legionella pneumophila]|nr:hypothetical protein [Legionella pneumophila subsp. pneumophila]HAU0830349.1 hypothetical protein [Legionella pneumophila]
MPYWDDNDLVTKGAKHRHYRKGYKFTDPTHDVLSVEDSTPANLTGKFGTYNYTYEPTAGYGQTVFWKLTKEFLTAQNHSVNPSITPGNRITQLSDCSKIVFDNNDYLCVDVELSQSGEGANVSQYYIVENAFNTSTPVLHYYFFNKDIMPMTDAN